jgi:hypothetical protein
MMFFRKPAATFPDHARASRWRNKVRRRFYSPYNKLIHHGRYFVCRYFGADFLVRSANVGGLEISRARIRPEPGVPERLKRPNRTFRFSRRAAPIRRQSPLPFPRC